MNKLNELKAFAQLLDELHSKGYEVITIYAANKNDMRNFCLIPSQYYQSIVREVKQNGGDATPEAVIHSLRDMLIDSLEEMNFVKMTTLKPIDPFKSKDN